MQLGLESIGPCDLYSTAEVIMLAEKSLCEISDDHILDISHMGILHSMLEASGLENEKHGALIDAISRRSTDAVRSLIKDTEIADKICRLVSEYAPATQLIGLLEEILPESPSVTELKGVVSVLSALSLDKKIYLDFSLVNDISYYNGIIFKGFISGIPSAVLSGGRYDPLITRFGMNCGACGFAIYLDRISGYEGSAIAKEADVLVLYGDSVAPEKLALTLDELVKSGKTVKAASASCAPDASLFGEIVTLSE